MFPEITKNKKKPKIGTNEMIKDCEDVMKQLQFKHKKALKVLPSELVSDFHKVCRLKEIRPFYSQYFFYFIHIASKESIETNFAEEVQNIMLGRSYYQQIESLMKERTLILNSLKQQLHVIEGFTIMNSGKNLPITLKGMINNLIKDCNSLDQVKTIEVNEVSKLTQMICKARENLKEISQMVISWQYRLRSFALNNEPASLKKMRVIYPENGINCILFSLYDTQFIKTSFLAQQMKFLGAQFDPFFLNVQPTKKTSRILKENLIQTLQEKSHQYKNIQSFIFDSIPKNQQKLEEERQREKQKHKYKQKQIKRAAKSDNKFYSLEKQKTKDKRKSEKKHLNQFMGSTLIEHRNETKVYGIKNLKNQINIDSIVGIYKKQKKAKPSIYKDQQLSKSLSRSKSKSIESLEGHQGRVSRVKSVVIIAQRQVTVSSSDNRSRKSIGSIDKEKAMSRTFTNMKKVEKIQSIYKMSSSKNHSIKKQSPPKQKDTVSIQTDNFKKQKEDLIKEINKQKKEQETLKNIIKRVQNRTASQNRLYDQKMEEYQKQINSLKKRIRDRQVKYQKSSPNEKTQKNKNNDLISKVYQRKKNMSPSKLKDEDPEVNLFQSRLIDEKNSNKMLQNKIKELLKEKINLENLISKEGVIANKEKEIYQRKLQKYQQIINSLKKESNNQLKNRQSNKRFSLVGQTPDLYSSPKKSLTKQERLLKLYAKRQTIQGIGHEKQTRLNKSPENTKETKIQISGSEQNNQIGELKSEKGSEQSDLKITNSRNTIEIVYNPKKHKKAKKLSEDSLNQQNSSHLRQKQREYQKHMFQLEKQKSLLERKLEVKMQGKSGTQAVLMKKLQQSELQLQKYRQVVAKQKSTNVRYDQRMKQLRKKINQEYEQKIERERKRFQEEKQHLFCKLKEQRESKMQKDKYLSKQMIFLKEMQMRQNELINMLEHERQERLEKERMLQQEILEKQQVLQEYELEEIKRLIEKQVRQQMNLIDKQEQEEFIQEEQVRAKQYEETKAQVEQQIKEMLLENGYELKEIDDENEKLKELIQKIKQEEQKIITNLQTGIANNEEQDDERLNTLSSIPLRYSRLNTAQNQLNNSINKSRIISGIQKKQNHEIYLETDQAPEEKQIKMIQELQQKSDLQLQTQRLTQSRYQEMQQSPNYKERQKIQNIIEHYLKNPHQYPSNNKIIMKPQEKTSLIEELSLKSKKAKEFEQQLMELKNVQSFVPAQRDDPISNHMLSLRQAYENEQAEALRKILFPAFNQQQKYNEEGQELSFESQEPHPPVTFGDHLKVHEDKYLEGKQLKKPSKNFMAINKLKLMKIEEEKKDKERQQIEEEGKRKLKKIIYKAKKKQEKQLKEFLVIKKQLQEKERKRQAELQKAKKGAQSIESQEKQDQNKQKRRKQLSQQDQENELSEQENELLAKETQDSNKKEKKQGKKVDNKKEIGAKKDEGQKQVAKDKSVTKNKVEPNEIIRQKQKSGIKQNKKKKDIAQNEVQNQFLNEFLSQPQNVVINKEVAKENQRESRESKREKLSETKRDIKEQQDEGKQKELDIQVKDQKPEQVTENKQIASQKNLKEDNKQKEEDEYYDEEFEQDSQDQPNEFIPKESEALKQLKKKLGQVSNKDKQHQQAQKMEQNDQPKQQKDEQGEQMPQRHELLTQSQLHQQQLSQNLPLMLLEHERSSLKQDLLSYQDEIRSYISSYSQFQVYQHFVDEKELSPYIDQLFELSSDEIKQLNNNPTLKKDLSIAQSVIILVAKDKQTKLELGIGLFHKEFQNSEYVCGYLLAHDMKNFLNLTFNFSRHIYQHDSFCHSVQYIFTLSALLDQSSKEHFQDFQTKCKRLGQIYLKGKQSTTRKYVLKRQLFEYISNQESFNEQKGIIFSTKIQLHETLMKEKNEGYASEMKENHTSPTVLLSLYLKENPQKLQTFKAQTQDDLKNRETLVTAMVFAKKELTLKTVQAQIFDTGQKIQLYKNLLGNVFTVDDVQQQVQQIKFSLSEIPPPNFKRCILEMNEISTPYCFVQFQETLNRIQASNSSQTGIFLPLVPKFKVLILPAGEFLTSCSSNTDMNVFFYTKHFIKNITEVKKEAIHRVYLPEIKDENWTFFRDISQKMNQTVFGRQKIQLGFESKISNSVIFTPRHDDFVIEKPFIISVLSASIERAIEGSPIFCRLIE